MKKLLFLFMVIVMLVVMATVAIAGESSEVVSEMSVMDWCFLGFIVLTFVSILYERNTGAWPWENAKVKAAYKDWIKKVKEKL